MMFGLIDNLARRLVRRGLRRGVLEGNTRWALIGAAALVGRFILRPERDNVVQERLKVGESLTVTHLPPPPTRRQARKAKARSTAESSAPARQH